MRIILSPAKLFRDYGSEELKAYQPLRYQVQTNALVERLGKLEVGDLEKVMKISKELAQCNHKRFANFHKPGQKGYHAVDYFYGEAFKGLDAPSLSQEARAFMKDHLSILSGLYGLLNPLDVIQPYRLEMGTKLSAVKGDSLYSIWKSLLTKDLLNQLASCKGEKVLLNLASDEYSKAVDLKQIDQTCRVVTCHFKVKKGEQYKVVGMYAKKARGLMVRYICEHQIREAEKIKAFDLEGYQYDESLSTASDWVFIKK